MDFDWRSDIICRDFLVYFCKPLPSGIFFPPQLSVSCSNTMIVTLMYSTDMMQQRLSSPRTHHPTPLLSASIALGYNDITRTCPELKLDTPRSSSPQRSPRQQHIARVETESSLIWSELPPLARSLAFPSF